MDLEHVKRVGIAAAYKSAAILNSYFGKIPGVNKKGAIDLVTVADTESEKVIIQTIRRNFPDHTILAEESGLAEGASDFQWIVDPLDGTTNFAHNQGIFANSIAFARQGEVAFGIVLIPASGELFTATAGAGATLNGRPISVSGVSHISESLLVTGFPYEFKSIIGPIMDRFSNCLTASQGVRRLGSAAIDLCFVACGRFEAFWEQQLQPWDTAAGMLIVKEAGGVVTDFDNRPFGMHAKEILATNGLIHEAMLEVLKLS